MSKFKNFVKEAGKNLAIGSAVVLASMSFANRLAAQNTPADSVKKNSITLIGASVGSSGLDVDINGTTTCPQIAEKNFMEAFGTKEFVGEDHTTDNPNSWSSKNSNLNEGHGRHKCVATDGFDANVSNNAGSQGFANQYWKDNVTDPGKSKIQFIKYPLMTNSDKNKTVPFNANEYGYVAVGGSGTDIVIGDNQGTNWSMMIACLPQSIKSGEGAQVNMIANQFNVPVGEFKTKKGVEKFDSTYTRLEGSIEYGTNYVITIKNDKNAATTPTDSTTTDKLNKVKNIAKGDKDKKVSTSTSTPKINFGISEVVTTGNLDKSRMSIDDMTVTFSQSDLLKYFGVECFNTTRDRIYDAPIKGAYPGCEGKEAGGAVWVTRKAVGGVTTYYPLGAGTDSKINGTDSIKINDVIIPFNGTLMTYRALIDDTATDFVRAIATIDTLGVGKDQETYVNVFRLETGTSLRFKIDGATQLEWIDVNMKNAVEKRCDKTLVVKDAEGNELIRLSLFSFENYKPKNYSDMKK